MIKSIDFQTLRENCIGIHQQVFLLGKVAQQIGVELPIPSADALKTNYSTKTWDGLGRFAKELYDNVEIWQKLPDELTIGIDVGFQGQKYGWSKTEARQCLLDSFNALGGMTLFTN